MLSIDNIIPHCYNHGMNTKAYKLAAYATIISAVFMLACSVEAYAYAARMASMVVDASTLVSSAHRG